MIKGNKIIAALPGQSPIIVYNSPCLIDIENTVMVYYGSIKKSIEPQDKRYQKESEDKRKIVIVFSCSRSFSLCTSYR
jgi:hypothetical protein